MKNTISFVIITYNEEARISNVIKNFIPYGDVIILDGGSTDKTKELSEKLGAKFYLRPENKKIQAENQENFNFIKSMIKTDWIYWGHADYMAPKTLIEKMIGLSQQEKVKTVAIPLYTYMWGVTTHPTLKSHTSMFFHKDFRDFSEERIHCQGEFTGTDDQYLILPDKKEYALRHFSVYDEHKFVLGHLRYAETEATQKYRQKKKFNVFIMLAAMIRYMWIYGKYSYKNGTLGLIIVLNYAFFRLMTYAKLYELEHDITLEKVEERYKIEKEKILSDF